MAVSVLQLMNIDTYDSFSLGLADVSQYSPNFVITNPTVEITPPGYPKIALPFTAQSVNIFRASDLKIVCDDSCSPLPDGVYTITYTVFPASTYSVTKNFLRVNEIVCKLQKLYLATDMECNCPSWYLISTKKTLSTIKLLIEGAISSANDGNQVTSFQLYRKADDMLDNIIKCNKNCGCK